MRSMNVHDSGFSECTSSSNFRRLPSYKSTMRRQRMVNVVQKTKEFSMASPLYQSTPKRPARQHPSQRRHIRQQVESISHYVNRNDDAIETCRNYDQVPDMNENLTVSTPCHIYENCFTRYLEEDARFNSMPFGEIVDQSFNGSYQADTSLRDADELKDLLLFREELQQVEQKRCRNLRRIPTKRAPVRFLQPQNIRRSLRMRNGNVTRRPQVDINMNSRSEPRKPRKKLTFGRFLAETGMDILKSVTNLFGKKKTK